MADKAGSPPRAWQRMLSGRRLDLLDPSPLDVEIADIAHGLARVARWNGQTITPKDKVQLEGKVDKDWSSVEVDVKNIKKLP